MPLLPEAPPELPPEIAILIILPYFVAVIAAIIYTNKQIKKGDHKDENSSKDIPSNNNNND